MPTPQIKREKDDFINKWWSKLTKPWKLVLIICGIILGSIIALAIAVTIISNGIESYQKLFLARGLETPSQVSQNPVIEKDEAVVDDNFDEFEKGEVLGSFVPEINFNDWQVKGAYIVDPDNPNAVCPALNKEFSEGSEWFYPSGEYAPNFSISFKVIPQSLYYLSAAVVYENIFRCIVGDNNYKHIDCQAYNDSYDSWVSLTDVNGIFKPWINKDHRIQPRSDLFIDLIVTPEDNSQLLNLDLTVRYIASDNNLSNFQSTTFNYQVRTGHDISELKRRVGVSLLDINDPPDVCAEFSNFIIKEI